MNLFNTRVYCLPLARKNCSNKHTPDAHVNFPTRSGELEIVTKYHSQTYS